MALQHLQLRQIWAEPGRSTPNCEGYRLPVPGTITLNDNVTLTLEEDATFLPVCGTAAATALPNVTLPVYDLGDPFEASVVPQMFVLGAMLVVAWALVIILVITPRTSFVLGTGVEHLGRSNGNSSMVISVGGRPWLQKFAALTVAVSLFIATVNSFKIIEYQYDQGYQDALAVTNGVVNSYEVRIFRVISTTFVWLAQVQTLIRLFPRHREKVMIKWAGFGLILLDTLFVTLNNFVAHGGDGPKTIRPRAYTEVIPVLSYLFELSLNLLYAAWVLYYSFVKRRFAFFHPQMRNIAVVALLSYVSVLIPVVFFITDIAKSQVAAWGDYIRWVGSAAASVVVWEWVERIEALEREERKNGILGREIFDGDEFTRKTPSLHFRWPKPTRSRKGASDGSSTLNSRPSRGDSTESPIPPNTQDSQLMPLTNFRAAVTGQGNDTVGTTRPRRSLLQTFRPPVTISPVPRSDTASAASTVYAVVHHPPSTTTTPAQDPSAIAAKQVQKTILDQNQADSKSDTSTQPDMPAPQPRSIHFLPGVGNPFKRRRSSPPPEVSRAAVDAAGRPSQARWNTRRSPKHLFRLNRTQVLPADLPIVVVPAQPRGQIWTPPAEDDTDDVALRDTTSEPRAEEINPARTPLSLDGSLQDTNRASYWPAGSTTDRHSPNLVQSLHQNEYLSASPPSAQYNIDRTHSPRSPLARVDEHFESGHAADNTSHITNSRSEAGPSIPPAG